MKSNIKLVLRFVTVQVEVDLEQMITTKLNQRLKMLEGVLVLG